ncbi:hypothetical protein TorRG33x02_182750, partial [Trema orientale]
AGEAGRPLVGPGLGVGWVGPGCYDKNLTKKGRKTGYEERQQDKRDGERGREDWEGK